MKTTNVRSYVSMFGLLLIPEFTEQMVHYRRTPTGFSTEGVGTRACLLPPCGVFGGL